ncbi:polysaccharide pyruvyl transferase family protein, partial [Mailhella sp.]|uniref:polysaccharide pyruvyl transferase family protein n=1 Tax=Mailhella sp. TaxID=1981029 RepID=UPI004064762D
DTYKIAPEERRGGIYFVDFELESAPQEQRDIINDILQSYAGEAVYQVRHDCPMSMNPQEKLESAQTLIRTYAHARLVVTSRIHCALPCLGLGVPVILACRRFDVKRYQGLFEFFNYVGWDSEENFINTVLLSESGSVVNRTVHEAYAERLRTLCRRFCGTENKVLRDSAHTPSLQDVFRLEQYASTYKEDSDRRLRQLRGQLHALEQHRERSDARVQDMEVYCVRLEQKLRILEKGILRIRIKAKAYKLLSKATGGRLRRRFLEKRRKYEQMLAFMKI